MGSYGMAIIVPSISQTLRCPLGNGFVANIRYCLGTVFIVLCFFAILYHTVSKIMPFEAAHSNSVAGSSLKLTLLAYIFIFSVLFIQLFIAKTSVLEMKAECFRDHHSQMHFKCSHRPAGLPWEGRNEIQDRSHVSPAWIFKCAPG